MRRLIVARVASEDIDSILSLSVERFGPLARMRYEALLSTALESLCTDPERHGSIPRDEIAESVRSFHLRFSREAARTHAGVVHRPRHVIVYRLSGDEDIEVLRVLHDRMEIQQHLPRQMEDEDSGEPGH